MSHSSPRLGRSVLDNHIGEIIRTPAGETAYLKTLRLSAAQVRRGYLGQAAKGMGLTPPQLHTRIHLAGFGGCFANPVRRARSIGR